mgnify:CR=1 FL=1
MTVSTTTTVITYSGNGATTVFSFPFIGVAASDISVSYTDSAGTVTVLNPTQYTLVLNPAAPGSLWGIGGSVTYPNTGSPPVPIAAGTFLSIQRTLPLTQTISISNQGAFYPQAVEQALDKLEMQIQQIATDVAYCFKAPSTDLNPPNDLPSAAARANGTFQFDANGQPIVGFPTPGGGGGTTGTGTPRKVATTGTATIGVLAGDSFGGVSIYQSGSPVTTVQLPTGNGPYPIFDASGNAGTYPITILPPAGKTINGLSQYILAFNYQSAVFCIDASSVLVAG